MRPSPRPADKADGGGGEVRRGEHPASGVPSALPTTVASHPRRALLLVCLSAVATATNYTNHGPLLGLISAEWGLTAAAAGAIATAVFVGATLTMPLGGLFADRFGPRPMVTLGHGLVVVSNLGSGLLASDYASLLLWRSLAGLGAGTGFAAGASYTRNAFRGGGLHLAQGLYGASFLLGSGLSLLVMPLLAGTAQDWRRAFALSGIGVLLTWLGWVWLAPPGPGPRRGPGSGLGAAARARNTWLLALCHMCGFGLAIVVGTWATVYLVREFRLPLVWAGSLGSLLLVTGIAARSAGGAILERGVPPLRLIRLSLVMAAMGLAMMAAPLHWLPLALAGLLVTGIGVGLPYAAVFNGAAASVPRSPASAQAIVAFGASFFTVVGPPLVGALVDLSGSFSASLAVLAVFSLGVLAGTQLFKPFSLASSGHEI